MVVLVLCFTLHWRIVAVLKSLTVILNNMLLAIMFIFAYTCFFPDLFYLQGDINGEIAMTAYVVTALLECKCNTQVFTFYNVLVAPSAMWFLASSL